MKRLSREKICCLILHDGNSFCNSKLIVVRIRLIHVEFIQVKEVLPHCTGNKLAIPVFAPRRRQCMRHLGAVIVGTEGVPIDAIFLFGLCAPCFKLAAYRLGKGRHLPYCNDNCGINIRNRDSHINRNGTAMRFISCLPTGRSDRRQIMDGIISGFCHGGSANHAQQGSKQTQFLHHCHLFKKGRTWLPTPAQRSYFTRIAYSISAVSPSMGASHSSSGRFAGSM